MVKGISQPTSIEAPELQSNIFEQFKCSWFTTFRLSKHIIKLKCTKFYNIWEANGETMNMTITKIIGSGICLSQKKRVYYKL